MGNMWIRHMHISIRRTFVCAIIRSVRNVAHSHTIHYVASSTYSLRLSELCFRTRNLTERRTYMHMCLRIYILCVPTFYYNIFSSTYIRPHTYISWHNHPLSKQPLSAQRSPHHLRELRVHASWEFVFVAVKPNVWKLVYAPPLSIHFNSSSRARALLKM